MLTVNGIKKIYPNGKGLKPFFLKAEPGEIVCLIGPNGSGKTTAFNMIAGIAQSDGGECLIGDLSTSDIEAKKEIGFLEESPYYYDKITVENFLGFIWGIKYKGEPNGDIYRLLAKFDLLKRKGYKLQELSMGLKKRVGVISALMHYPKLIILDEPANGLDSQSLILLKDELVAAGKQDCVILISSHILDFLKDIGTRFVFLKNGVIKKELPRSQNVSLDETYRSLYMSKM
ncbi:MAG: ABC transporter ATP-binding protein [Clostridiales bacterium]|nr:ABC transporter ATP-binding protein [Clostridiales bacterium]MDR2750126.1 ABC transporter ATP-binding protein [Clostridiales bacterium]